MGANPTQAQAIVLFLAAFTLMSVGIAREFSLVFFVPGLICLAASIVMFRKCRPWEQTE